MPGADPSVDGIPTPQDRPEICIIAKGLPEAVDQAIQAMTAFNQPPRLFLYQGKLVRQLGVGCGDTEVSLDEVGVPELQAELTYAARWSEKTEKGQKSIYPPSLIARDNLFRAATWAPPL